MRVLLSDRNARIPGWSIEKLTRPRFDRNTVELRRFVGIEGSLSASAVSVVTRYASGHLSRDKAMTEFREKLTTAETHTFVAGKRAAGRTTLVVTPDEKKMLDGRMSRNMRYFSNFLDDIKEGRTRMPIERRARLYGKSLWSIYNRGQSNIDWGNPDPNKRYMWIPDFDAEHCADCWKNYEDSERQGGFTFDELIERGFPGEKTACIVRCRCHLRVGYARKSKPPESPPGGGEQERFPEMMMVGQGSAGGGGGQFIQQNMPELEPAQILTKAIAEGSRNPVYLPAAGLPAVVAQPGIIAGMALKEAARQSDRTGQALDSALNAYLTDLEGLLRPLLTRPRLLVPQGESTRIYVGNHGARAEVKHGPGGLWYLAALILENEEEERNESIEELRKKFVA